jgi:hypothetical protein
MAPRPPAIACDWQARVRDSTLRQRNVENSAKAAKTAKTAKETLVVGLARRDLQKPGSDKNGYP